MWPLKSHVLCVHLCCRKGKGCYPFIVVTLVDFTESGGTLMADLRVMFLIAGINGLDECAVSVEVVGFADSCNFILDAARKSVVELALEGSVTPIDFGGELLKADNVFSNFPVLTCSSSFSASASMLNRLKLVWSSEMSLS